jgi:hypothetical protein
MFGISLNTILATVEPIAKPLIEKHEVSMRQCETEPEKDAAFALADEIGSLPGSEVRAFTANINGKRVCAVIATDRGAIEAAGAVLNEAGAAL